MLNATSIRVLAILVAGVPAYGSILYETATNGGGSSNGGNGVLQTQFLGTRFTLGYGSTITTITAQVQNFEGTDPFFLTLLQLSGPGLLPNNLIGDPFGGTTQIYTTTFNAAPQFSAEEVAIPLSLSVPAGTYAIVVGTGLFGSPNTSIGSMPTSFFSGNVVLPGADLIIWYDPTQSPGQFASGRWLETVNFGERFEVQGTTPEPLSSITVFLGLIALASKLAKPKKGWWGSAARAVFSL